MLSYLSPFLSLDSIIFISFLIINLILGLTSGRGIKTIREYAIGDRNFSTSAIVATVVATWISGESFFSYLSDGYAHGLYAIWSYMFGELLYFAFVGFIVAPRLGVFLGKLSIAEVMGDLYGKNVRIITAIVGFISTSGLIAIQLKVAGLLFEYAFNIPDVYGVIIAGIIITIYSSFGGIKSVTFTDIIQFMTFGTIVPIIAYFILSTLGSIDVVIDTMKTHQLFDYHKVFDFRQTKSLYHLTIAIIVLASGFGPPMFQRMVMVRNVAQLKKSFIISGGTCFFLSIMMSWMGILVLSTHPDVGPSGVVKHIIFNYSYVGLKGMALAGIMAMVMSTADSYVNSSAVLFVHDFCQPLGIKIAKDELISSRFMSLLIGGVSIVLALRNSGSLMQLLIFANILYIPVVTVPFLLAVFGFKSSSISVLIGMSASIVTVILWEVFLKAQAGGIDAIVPAMLANLIVLIMSHYLFNYIACRTKTKLKI